MRHFGKCPVCKKEKHLTRHHILPRRFFGNIEEIVLVCRICHDDIEKEIPDYQKMTTEFYYDILIKFGIYERIWS